MPLPPPLTLPWQSPSCPPALAVGAAVWPTTRLSPLTTLAVGRHGTTITLVAVDGAPPATPSLALKTLPHAASAAAEGAAMAAAHAVAPHCVLAVHAAFDIPGGAGALVVERAAATARAAARRAGGFLLEPDAAATVGSVARALAAVHEMGYVHGDVKSENVFIVSRGADDVRFVLGDWGSAAAVGGRPPHTTPAARPPVPCAVASPADDMWSVGALAAELLCGGGPDAQGRVQLPRHLSTGARALVTAALAPRPQDRPTAAQLVAMPWVSGGGV